MFGTCYNIIIRFYLNRWLLWVSDVSIKVNIWMSTQKKLLWHKLSHVIVKQYKWSGLSSATFTHKAFVNLCLTLSSRFRCIFSMSHDVPLHRNTTGARHADDDDDDDRHTYGETRGTNFALLRGLAIPKQSNAFSYPTASCALNLQNKL